jgi:hemerythrin-like domain-containing protein
MYIPQHTRGAIDRYVLEGIPTGDFMYNVLLNDLGGAVAHADEQNSIYLVNIVKFIHNYVPQCCHGSREAIACWLKAHKEKTPIVEQAKAFYNERLEHIS